MVENQLERQHVNEKLNKLLVDATKGVVVDGSMILIHSASGLDELHQGIIEPTVRVGHIAVLQEQLRR